MNSGRKILSFTRKLLPDIFYPRRCIMCNSTINIGKDICICRDCHKDLKNQGQVIRDGEKFFEEAISALEYDGNVKEAMREFKFRGKTHLAGSFSYAINQKIKNREFLKSVSHICPVPIHPLRNREYNQSELIARGVAMGNSISHVPDMLIKLCNLKPLSTMSFAQRVRMIKSTIGFNVKYNIEGKVICLVDDIYTSGATVNECAKVLRMYGAQKVYVLTACYAAKNDTGGTENADTNIRSK